MQPGLFPGWRPFAPFDHCQMENTAGFPESLYRSWPGKLGIRFGIQRTTSRGTFCPSNRLKSFFEKQHADSEATLPDRAAPE